jgi:hypothetical protein
VHRCSFGEFLVRQVADRDDEIALVPDIADVAGPQPGQRQAVAPGGGRAGVAGRARCGLRPPWSWTGRRRTVRCGPVRNGGPVRYRGPVMRPSFPAAR